MSLIDSRRPSDEHILVTGQVKDVTRELTIVDIGTISALTHLIPETERCWLVNSWIDLRMFDDIY